MSGNGGSIWLDFKIGRGWSLDESGTVWTSRNSFPACFLKISYSFALGTVSTPTMPRRMVLAILQVSHTKGPSGDPAPRVQSSNESSEIDAPCHRIGCRLVRDDPQHPQAAQIVLQCPEVLKSSPTSPDSWSSYKNSRSCYKNSRNSYKNSWSSYKNSWVDHSKRSEIDIHGTQSSSGPSPTPIYCVDCSTMLRNNSNPLQ